MNSEMILAFAAANPAAARTILDAAIAKETDGDAVARLEVLREYLTNAEFKANLEAHSFAKTYRKGA